MYKHEMLKQYALINVQIKFLEAQRNQLKTEIVKHIKAHGNTQSDDFTAVLTVSERRSLAGLEDVARVFTEEALKKNNLIKITSVETLKVSPNGGKK